MRKKQSQQPVYTGLAQISRSSSSEMEAAIIDRTTLVVQVIFCDC